MPSGQTFQIDVNTDVYSYVWGSIEYSGIRIPNCDTGNCIKSCDIRILDAKKSVHKGMWTCTSNVKIDDGKYADNVNVTFGGSIIGKYSQIWTPMAEIVFNGMFVRAAKTWIL